MIFLHFIYGLAFFSLGLIVGLEAFRPIPSEIKPAFRDLAAYGLLGALHHWFEVWESTGRHFVAGPGVAVDVGAMTISLLFLAGFGARLITDSRPLMYAFPFGLAALWLGVSTIGPELQGAELHEHLIVFDVLFILVPANLATAWGFAYGRPLVGKADELVRSDKLVLSGLFVTDAILSGFGSIALTAVPLLIARSFTAVAITVFVIRVLRVFENEFVRDQMRIEAIEYDAKLAAEVQKELTPAGPLMRPEAQAHALILPARVVAGDIYDYKWADNKLSFMIADMSGKGAPAAVLSTAALISLDRAAEGGDEPARLLELTNEFLEKRFPENSFMTMLVGQYSPATRMIALASAGHPQAFLFEADMGQWRALDIPGSLPLGIFPDARPANITLKVRTGDRLFLYTDGLIDAKLPDGSRLGAVRVEEWLEDRVGETTDKLLNELREFILNMTLEQIADDVAVVVIDIR